MKIPPAKGTRDFYPEQMAEHNFIVDGWKTASIRNGFEEYDGPIFEYLKMYQVKSGDEIAEQLFSLTDRGGRELAIRPEITPTLARMVNQQINALSRPIKWFSVPRLCRAERPQKGRLREFYQWNLDIIGIEDVLADAEVIFTTVDYLEQVGLSEKDVKVKISSRKLLAQFLLAIGIEESQLEKIYPVLDKKPKISAEAFEEMLKTIIAEPKLIEEITSFMSIDSMDKVSDLLANHPDKTAGLDESICELKRCFELLEQMGIGDYCVFDPGIVRGLAYYTGIVFEVHDIVGDLRAIAGGGRYDNLLKQFGGPEVTGTGIGMGDCVLQILLEQKGLLKPELRKVDFFIACADKQYFEQAVSMAIKLRRLGFKANFSYKAVGLGKQMKQASAQNADKCIIIGSEFGDGRIVMKNMQSGDQKDLAVQEFMSDLKT